MNKAMISGNFVRDIELNTKSKTSIARFTLAVTRRFKNKNGEYEADFPTFVAFDKTAEFIAKYFKKGDRMEVVGRIQTGSYESTDGSNKRIYTTEIIVEEAGFGGKKSGDGSTRNDVKDVEDDNGYLPPPEDDVSLPFEL